MNSEIYNYQPIQFCIINSLIEFGVGVRLTLLDYNHLR